MRRVPEFQFEWIDRSHPNRASVESFIATVFARRYGAQVRYFSDVIIGSRDEEGRWIAAVGFSALSHHSAYLENYLDQPVEYLIAASVRSGQLFRRVSRWDIVEVGNLAAIRARRTRPNPTHDTLFVSPSLSMGCANRNEGVIKFLFPLRVSADRNYRSRPKSLRGLREKLGYLL